VSGGGLICGGARRVSPRQASSFWLDPKGTKRSSPHCARPSPSARGSRVCGQGRGRAETPCAHFVRFGQTVCPGQFTRRAARAPQPWPQTRRRRGASPNSQQPNPAIRSLPAHRHSKSGCLAVGCWGSAPFAPPALAPRQGRVPQARHPSSSARLSDRSERSERREFLAGPCLGARAGYSLAEPRSERIRGLIFWFLLDQAKRNSPAGARPGGLSRKWSSR
jgi:hypothetical protein